MIKGSEAVTSPARACLGMPSMTDGALANLVTYISRSAGPEEPGMDPQKA